MLEGKKSVMKKMNLLLSLCLVCLFVLQVPFCSAAGLGDVSKQSFGEIVVFGDSLADNGNYYAASGQTWPPSPPYWEGRFSNGPVWVEYLADYMGLSAELKDWAVGYATSTDMLYNQIIPYLGSEAIYTDSLYILQSGSNDFIEPVSTDPNVLVGTAVGNIVASIQTLYGYGARNFLIANAPDYGLMPLATKTGDPVIIGSMTAIAVAFNEALAGAIGQFELALPDATFYTVDFFGLINKAVANPSLYGLTNVVDAFLPEMIGNPNEFLFFDDIHPTTASHYLLVLDGISIKVVVDTKPGKLNTKSKGVMSVRILGTPDFDVADVDVLTVHLAGVGADRSSYEDVGTLAVGDGGVYAVDGPDGIVDLVLHFETASIVSAVGEVVDGEEVMLKLTGLSNDDTPIVGVDYVTVQSRGK